MAERYAGSLRRERLDHRQIVHVLISEYRSSLTSRKYQFRDGMRVLARHKAYSRRRRSCSRRTGAERGFATAKDPVTSDISRDWCRLMGLAPLMLFTTMLLVARNQRILAAWTAWQEDSQRRAAAGLPPRTRKRRRKTLAMLAAAPP